MHGSIRWSLPKIGASVLPNRSYICSLLYMSTYGKVNIQQYKLIWSVGKMEAKSICWEKVEKVEEEEDEVMVGDHEILKRRISSHPLYGLLVEAHLGCLKVGDTGELYINHSREQKPPENNASFGMANRSELDQFMEAYCMALAKLKEAMEEPQQKSMAFIKNMHSQLEELTSMHPVPAEHDTTSGE